MSGEFSLQAAELGAVPVPWEPGFPVDPAATRRLSRQLDKYRVDLTHAQDLRSSLVGAMAAKSRGIPTVRTVHMPEFFTAWDRDLRSRLRRGYYIWLERAANFLLADQVIFVSANVREQALRMRLTPRSRSQVVENGIDLNAFQNPDSSAEAARQELGVSRDVLVFSFVGRLDLQKGVDVLLGAAASMAETLPFEMWIIGDGNLRPASEEEVSRLGLEGQVRFLGWRQDIPALLSASDVFVLPSRYEGMSFTLLEALAAGVPSVVTDVGEAGRLVKKATCGLVVPPEDTAALADALSKLGMDGDLRRKMGRAGRRASRQFDVQKTVEGTLAVYDATLRSVPG